MTQLTISEARKNLLDLPEKLTREHEHTVIVTRRGQPVLAVLPWEFYESIVEALEVVNDHERMAQLRENIEDIEPGRLLSQGGWGPSRAMSDPVYADQGNPLLSGLASCRSVCDVGQQS